MSDTPELLPCPWCHSSTALEVRYDKDDWSYVYCRACLVQGPLEPVDPISSWNDRPQVAALADLATAHALLREWIAKDERYFDSENGECVHCRSFSRLVDSGPGYQTTLYPHTPDCIVMRTRAALAADGARAHEEDT